MSLFSENHTPCGACGEPATIHTRDGPRCAPCTPDSEKPARRRGRGVGVLSGVDRVLREKPPEVHNDA